VVSSGYRWVLFDLGGVLVRLGAVGPMAQLIGTTVADEFWSRWLASRWVRDFEGGKCSDEEFAAGIVAEWNLTATGTELLAAFECWPEDFYEGAVTLVEEVRRIVPVGCLSNSNAQHWSRFTSLWGLDRLFDIRLLSHEMGFVKPDGALFESVVARLGGPAASIVFVDDNDVNVRAAQAAGLTAATVSGVSGARRALEQFGVLVGGPSPG
jgi:putative hydrolase of the HAD superfamily